MDADRFTLDNTEGYSAAQLAELNRRFWARVERYYEALERQRRPNDLSKSQLDNIAEMVQRDYDTENS